MSDLIAIGFPPGRYGGHLLKTSLPEDAERQIREQLHGAAAAAA